MLNYVIIKFFLHCSELNRMVRSSKSNWIFVTVNFALNPMAWVEIKSGLLIRICIDSCGVG